MIEGDGQQCPIHNDTLESFISSIIMFESVIIFANSNMFSCSARQFWRLTVFKIIYLIHTWSEICLKVQLWIRCYYICHAESFKFILTVPLIITSYDMCICHSLGPRGKQILKLLTNLLNRDPFVIGVKCLGPSKTFLCPFSLKNQIII